MLVCGGCQSAWEETGNQWKRASGKVDYHCSVCGLKRKPIETDAVNEIIKTPVNEINRLARNIHLGYDDIINNLSKTHKYPNEVIDGWMGEMGSAVTNRQFADAKTRVLTESKRYLVTSAQNDSETNTQFFLNMKAFAKFINATLIIIPTRYRNPTAIEAKTTMVWDEDLNDYLFSQRLRLHQNLVIAGDIKIQSTSMNPIGGMTLLGGGSSVIVGAPMIQMKSYPVFPSEQNMFVHSTGSLSYPNMSDTVAGAKGTAHHSFGFVLVDIEDEDIVYTHNISAEDDGSFTCFNYRTQDEVVSQVQTPVLFMGDSHLAQQNKVVTKKQQELIKDFGVKTVVINDLFDASSMNVHTKDAVERYKLFWENKSNLKSELDQMYDFLGWFDDNVQETVVLRSNHDDMLERTLKQIDFSGDSENALLKAELLVELLKGQQKKGFKGLIPEFINNKYNNINALGVDDKYKYCNIFLMHGHIGGNGSRGSVAQFSNLPYKVLSGHTHSPEINKGAYCVGLSCNFDHGYNKGVSSWALCDCLISSEGKRQLIIRNKLNYKFTTLYDG